MDAFQNGPGGAAGKRKRLGLFVERGDSAVDENLLELVGRDLCVGFFYDVCAAPVQRGSR
jgi:hypothetical protein